MATAGMLHDVAAHRRNDEIQPGQGVRVETMCAPQDSGLQLDRADLKLISDVVQCGEGECADAEGDHAFHRTTVTLVPTPTVDTTANSFTSRRAPGRPRPRLPALENPSTSAFSMSGIPGP